MSPFVVVGVGEGLFGGFDGPLDEVLGNRLERGSRDLGLEVERAVVRRRDEREVDAGLLARGEFDLRLLCGVLQALEGLPVVAEVDAVFLLRTRRRGSR